MPPDQETMSFSKKRKSIQGFCTIGEATHLAIAAGGATEEDRKVQGGFSIAKNVMHKKESVVDEIEVRQVDATNSNMKINAESESEGTKSCSSSSKQKADPADFLRNLLTIDLTVRGIEHYKENIRSLDAVTLHREPQNAHGTPPEFHCDLYFSHVLPTNNFFLAVNEKIRMRSALRIAITMLSGTLQKSRHQFLPSQLIRISSAWTMYA